MFSFMLCQCPTLYGFNDDIYMLARIIDLSLQILFLRYIHNMQRTLCLMVHRIHCIQYRERQSFIDPLIESWIHSFICLLLSYFQGLAVVRKKKYKNNMYEKCSIHFKTPSIEITERLGTYQRYRYKLYSCNNFNFCTNLYNQN